MARRRLPANTDCFVYHNANPKNKNTTDCVFRAISTAMGKPWAEVLREMTEVAIHYGYAPNDKVCINKYLKKNGWVKQKQPKRYDGRKITGAQWATTAGSEPMIISIGSHHLSCIIDGQIWDTWDCSDRCVGSYWVKEN